MSLVCASPSCGRQRGRVQRSPRPPEEGMKLCSRCFAHLASVLALLPEAHSQCEELLVQYGCTDRTRVRGGLHTGMHLDESLLNVRAEVLSLLASWSSLVIEERRLSHAPRREVRELAVFLTRHLRWLASHPAAGDAAAELNHVSTRLKAALRSDAASRYEIGPCTQDGCQGRIEVTMRGRGSTRTTRVSCDFGHEWQPHEWLRLGALVAQARRGGQAT